MEVKRWIDPTTSAGKAKIVKGLFALKNFNGGYLVIGFDDETLQPDTNNIPENARETFHNDAIQDIVSHYASEPFDITVYYPEKMVKNIRSSPYRQECVPPLLRSEIFKRTEGF